VQEGDVEALMNRTVFRCEAARRVQFEETVALIGEAQPHLQEKALNISRGGMFVQSRQPHAIPPKLRVLFQLPGAGPIEASASVVRVAQATARSEPPGVGLRFDSMSEDCAERLDQFIDSRLEPAAGERLRLRLDDVGSVIGATAHSCWDGLLSVEAELPFLRVGSSVQVKSTHTARTSAGTVRWVTIHADTVSGVPRLNIGIDMAADSRMIDDIVHDEGDDPVLTREFADHSRAHEQAALLPRKTAAAK
jgi:uncharacterized protein (TIGR02266 family)